MWNDALIRFRVTLGVIALSIAALAPSEAHAENYKPSTGSGTTMTCLNAATKFEHSATTAIEAAAPAVLVIPVLRNVAREQDRLAVSALAGMKGGGFEPTKKAKLDNMMNNVGRIDANFHDALGSIARCSQGMQRMRE